MVNSDDSDNSSSMDNDDEDKGSKGDDNEYRQGSDHEDKDEFAEFNTKKKKVMHACCNLPHLYNNKQ